MAREGMGGDSSPPYPFSHEGPVLVCGNAWCLAEDLRRAREIYPDAPVIAVNGASAHVEAFALFTQHPTKMGGWKADQERNFGPCEVHCAGEAHLKNKLGIVPEMPWVDYWWDGIAAGGTSAWGARRLAGTIGFSPVVLCGVPLEPGRYSDGMVAKTMNEDNIARYRRSIEADKDWHDGVYSMSGWTREVFGCV